METALQFISRLCEMLTPAMRETERAFPVEVCLTKHAEIRIKERLGLSRNAGKKHASRAYNHGIVIEETDGRIFEFLIKRKRAVKGELRLRMYGDFLFVFSLCTLITVYRIPKRFSDE